MNYKKSKISIKSLAKALAELDSEDGDEEAAFSGWVGKFGPVETGTN